VVRRERTQLVDMIERSKAIYAPIGAKFHEQDKLWRFPNQARLRFAHLDRDSDAQNYMGHSYTRVYVEEITNFPSPDPIFKLMATLRSGAGVPVGFRATGNPGGPGHHWVKQRYIHPAPLGNQLLRANIHGTIRERIYIPARVDDNTAIDQDAYKANLRMSGSESLVKAWLDGDWNVIQGAYYPEFQISRHVIEPFQLPSHWTRFASFDWGSASPFALLWFAVSDGEFIKYPRNSLICYRELYGCNPQATNRGLKLSNLAIADLIHDAELGDRVNYRVADTSIFDHAGGPSIAEAFLSRGIRFQPADKRRIPGWDQLRGRLAGDADGHPMLFIFSTCPHLIRTLPALQHDERKPEDADTNGEDHLPDACRYAMMSRPWARSPKSESAPSFLNFSGKNPYRNVSLKAAPITIGEMIKFSDAKSKVRHKL
jgi:hypothetical protein